MRIPEVPDTFNVGVKTRAIGDALPNERHKLIRYLARFVRELDREDTKLKAFRQTWK